MITGSTMMHPLMGQSKKSGTESYFRSRGASESQIFLICEKIALPLQRSYLGTLKTVYSLLSVPAFFLRSLSY